MKNEFLAVILPLFLLVSCQVSNSNDLYENSKPLNDINQEVKITTDTDLNMTELCKEVYGPEHYVYSSVYREGTEVSSTDVLKSAADMTELQKKQILKYGKIKEILWISSNNVDDDVNNILINTDDKNVLYTIIKTPSGKSYEQFRVYLGDTEVSGLFLKGTTLMVARTEDTWCVQNDTTDFTQDINETGTLSEGNWNHYGPFTENNAIKAVLNVNSHVKATLYIRKETHSTRSAYDCRVRSYKTSDVSCAINGAGEYYVSIYTSTSTADNADKSFNLTITKSKEKIVNPETNEGKYCGSRGTIPADGCGDGYFCKYEDFAQCGATDMPGVCTKKVEGIKCSSEEKLVCGCDNVTYRNHCELTAANSSLAHTGPCEKPLKGEGEDCKLDSECSENLVCSNFNINDNVVGRNHGAFSMCIHESMRNEYTSNEFSQIYAGRAKETTIIVDGLATVAMNAFLSVEINMGWFDLSEELIFDIIAGNTGYDTHFTLSDVHPLKYKIELNGINQILTITDLPINCPGDDSVNGNWTLRISNSDNVYWVKLIGWDLKLSSRWD